MTVETAAPNSSKTMSSAPTETKSFADLSRELRASLDSLVAEDSTRSTSLNAKAREEKTLNATTTSSLPEN